MSEQGLQPQMVRTTSVGLLELLKDFVDKDNSTGVPNADDDVDIVVRTAKFQRLDSTKGFDDANLSGVDDVNFLGFQLFVVKHFAYDNKRLSDLSFRLLGEVFKKFQAAWLGFGGAVDMVKVVELLLENERAISAKNKKQELSQELHL